jgi:carbamate kinase
MRIAIALGGNALIRRGESSSIESQLHNISEAVKAIAEIAKEHTVVITHGNGPQIGLLALQAEAYQEVKSYPLDVLGAQTQGAIGYLLTQEIRNCLPEKEVVTLLTQVEVAIDDPAFDRPTKPIGPFYSKEEADKLATERGWNFACNRDSYRRVVPSPEPLRIMELATIEKLVSSGVLVICAGGGGIPIVVNSLGEVRGVEAVIDKDLATAVLANKLKLDALLILTDVDAVYTNWGTPEAQAIREATPELLQSYTWETGSMAPKIEAACRFVQSTGGYVGIGRLEDAAGILARQMGTILYQ